MFKERNNRFSVLSENNTSLPIVNRELSMNRELRNRPNYRETNGFNKPYNPFHTKNEIKNKKTEFSFSEDMFPSLSDNTKQLKDTMDDHIFLDKLLSENKEIDEEKKWVLPDGWVAVTRNAKDGNVSYNYGKNMKKEKEIGLFELCEELAYKYEKWEKDYINKWGEHEYYKMYKFPNYDYYYFDNLDEEYYQESENEQDNEDEYTDNYDDYSDYY